MAKNSAPANDGANTDVASPPESDPALVDAATSDANQSHTENVEATGLADPYALVRVSGASGEYTTTRAAAARKNLTIHEDKPAVDATTGRALPGKPRTDKAGDPARRQEA